MPLINLIAEQRAQLRNQGKKARIWFFAFAGTACMGAASVGFLFLRAESLGSEISSLQTKALELKPFEDAIAKNQKMLADLKPRLETLNTARMDTQRWSRILGHISLVMPDNTWLTSVAAQQGSDQTKPVEIAWTGMTTDQNLVGDLMLRMQKSIDLQNVQLRYTETKRTSTGEGVEFQIASEVMGTADAPIGSNRKETLKS